MARKSGEVLASHTHRFTGRHTEVVLGTGLYCVTYDNRPVNVRTTNAYTTMLPKYDTVGYVNKAHAVNKAAKLNKLFSTDKFSVTEMKP